MEYFGLMGLSSHPLARRPARHPAHSGRGVQQARKQAALLKHCTAAANAINRAYSRHRNPSAAITKRYQAALAILSKKCQSLAAGSAGSAGSAGACDAGSVMTCFDGSFPDAQGNCDDGSFPDCEPIPAKQGTNQKSPFGTPQNFTRGQYVPPANPAQAPVCDDNSLPTCDDGTLPDANGNCRNQNDQPWCHDGTPPNWQGTSGLGGMGQWEAAVAGALIPGISSLFGGNKDASTAAKIQAHAQKQANQTALQVAQLQAAQAAQAEQASASTTQYEVVGGIAAIALLAVGLMFYAGKGKK